MDEMLEQLLSVLSQEKEVIDKLLKLAAEKTFALSDDNVEEVRNIVEQEQKVHTNMERLEKSRNEIVERISSMLETLNSICTISDIIDNIQEPAKTRLKEIQHELHKNIFELRQINELNMALAQNNLRFVDFMINSMSNNLNESVIYGTNGATNQESLKKRIFDNKV